MGRYYLPDEVHFYLKREMSYSSDQGPSYRVRQAFPVASRSIERGHKVVKTAEEWGRGLPGFPWKEDALTPATILVLKNIPKSGFRLVSLVSRAEGGRAGKVITPEGFLVDLREDVFTHILFTKGVPADGLLDAELLWCQNGSQLRLDIPGSPGFDKYTPEPEVP